MRGKRAYKKALRVWREQYFDQPSDPALCTCGHDDLAACWHFSTCVIKARAVAAHPRRGVR